MKKLSILYLLLCLVIVGCETTQNSAQSDILNHTFVTTDPIADLMKLANAGKVAAKYELAECYREGKLTEKNIDEAIAWYKAAASEDYVDAITDLADLYDDLEEYELAFEYYMKGAKLGNSYSQRSVAFAYNYGRGVEKNIKLAIKWNKKSARQGNRIAIFRLGSIYEEMGDSKLALKYYKKSADKGYYMACAVIGNYYRLGSCLEKDLDKAIYFLDKASKKEANNVSLHNLAQACQENGETEKALSCLKLSIKQGYVNSMNLAGNFCQENGDYEEAIRYYKMGIEHDDPYALCNLGAMYKNGEGLPTDFDKALELYEKAVDLDFDYAFYSIGRLYNAKESYAEALEYYEKAADAGITKAYFGLGYAYHLGLGVDQNDEQAIEWYEKAIEVGNDMAINNLGEVYRERGNYKKALELYHQATELGSDVAMCNIAEFYRDGLGVAVDLEEAVEWFKKSADAGFDLAKEELEKEAYAEYLK